jgi:hypothetical protein
MSTVLPEDCASHETHLVFSNCVAPDDRDGLRRAGRIGARRRCELQDVPTAVRARPQRFINGDPTLWKKNVSQRDESIIIGGWGAYEQGWKDISSRYDWAAARFRKSGAKVTPEYLVTAASSDIAYTGPSSAASSISSIRTSLPRWCCASTYESSETLAWECFYTRVSMITS